MKKKLLTLVLATSVAVMSLTGCGPLLKSYMRYTEKAQEAQEEVEAQEKNIQVSIESAKQETESIAETATGIEATTAEAPTTESVAESVVSTEQVAMENVDWSTTYDDYFERDNIVPANLKVTTVATAENVKMSIVVANAGDTMQLGFDFGDTVTEMYGTKDKVYCYTKMMGQESWTYAIPQSQEELDSLSEMQDSQNFNTDSIKAYSYKEEVEEDGVVYDTLNAVLEDEDGSVNDMVVYINRETQMISRYEMEKDGAVAVCYFEEIDSIELPAEAANATESTMENIVMSLFAVMLMGAGAAAQ